MADQRALKLANAKRKLKKFQKRQLDDSGTIPSTESNDNSLNQLNVSSNNETNVETPTAKNTVQSPLQRISSRGHNLSNSFNSSVDGSIVINGQENTASMDNTDNEIEKLKSELEEQRSSFLQQRRKEQESLNDQLQVHVQTIGILVAEKSELQNQLTRTQKSLDLVSRDKETLHNKLLEHKNKMSELERNLVASSEANGNLNDIMQDRKQLKLMVDSLRQNTDDLSDQINELKGKLQTQAQESANLRKVNSELNSKLELSEVIVNQLSTNSDVANMQQVIQKLNEEKREMQARLTQMMSKLHRLTAEKEAVIQQQSDITMQSEQYLHHLEKELEDVKVERDSLITENHQRQATIDQLTHSLENRQDSQNKEVNLQLAEKFGRITEEKGELEQSHKELTSKHIELKRLYMEKVSYLGELESEVSILQDESVDREKLLETLQSDQETISRALTQNKDLKNRLAELQEKFVIMSNENMELNTKLESFTYTAKESTDKVHEKEVQLRQTIKQLTDREQQLDLINSANDSLISQLSDQKNIYNQLSSNFEKQTKELEELNLKIKSQESELLVTREKLSEVSYQLNQSVRQNSNLSEYVNQQNQDNDRMRSELQSVKDTNSSISRELQVAQEKASLLDMASGRNQYNTENVGNIEKDSNVMLELLSASVRQLELERDQLIQQVKEEIDAKEKLTKQLTEHGNLVNQLSVDVTANNADNTDSESTEKFRILQDAMEKLQARFVTVMEENASLSEKVYELDHLNVQLSSETDTIGEYIALYHKQRDALRTRYDEKERLIAQLTEQRQDMQEKTQQLQKLILQLVHEKQQLQLQVTNLTGDSSQNASLNFQNPTAFTAESTALKSASEVANNTLPNDSNLLSTKDNLESYSVNDETAKEIVQLLQEVEATSQTASFITKEIESGIVNEPRVTDTQILIPCAFCVGRLQEI
ncbi:Golgin subfamily A member 2 [Trichoplax sp. H2]|nr:Golgin subfamily A member 2 [Trichoplax sp. H2]|eukprot:RDD43492.1 Golgin subfamily A member 2 [Trichoplax sp. H2]